MSNGSTIEPWFTDRFSCHIVFANGVSTTPIFPDLPGLAARPGAALR
jgi:hypothetical protein